MDEKREISLEDAGIVIGILSGVMAIFESILILSVLRLPWTRGWVGLTASILLLAGAITVYKGRTVLGVVIMFFSSLISELAGGYLGGVISKLVPTQLPWYNRYFYVTQWMLFGLLSSILILFSLWKKKREVSLNTVGIILGFLGGVGAVVESSIVVARTNGGCGLFSLIVAILVLAGAIIVYKGPRLLGALIMFFSTLIGQLIGDAIGLAIAAFTVPPQPPWFTRTFGVSSWTIFGLVGSILILLSIWKGRKR